MFFISPFSFLLASLVPLAFASYEDAKTRMVSNVWGVLLFLLGVGLNIELFVNGFYGYNLFAVAFSFLIAVMVKLKPNLLPKGDSFLLFVLALLYSGYLIPLLGLTVLFSLVWNTVKRRPFNTPLPLAPFLFIAGCAINAFILLGFAR